MTKIRKIFKWADRGKYWTSKQTRSANRIRSLLLVQPTLWFLFCQANSKAPKVGQVFRHATCNNHSFVVLFVDRSIMKPMLQFVEVPKVFGWPKFPQPSEWTNFPHATLCVRLNKMMTKLFWCRYNINNLMQEYTKVERRRQSWRKQWL